MHVLLRPGGVAPCSPRLHAVMDACGRPKASQEKIFFGRASFAPSRTSSIKSTYACGSAHAPRGNRHGGPGGSMSAAMAGSVDGRETFDRLLAELRPKLHRYCARMTGSVIDGEDVVQEALAKAIEAFPDAGTILHAESWLFRIAHNAALDFLRRRARADALRSDEDPDLVVDPASAADDRRIAAASLRTFMRLPVAQRSSVILMDVL